MRTAFQHEVRPDEYLGRVWVTSIIAGLVFAALTCLKPGGFDASYLVPMSGWQAHDPAGGLYVETWATVLVNALQVGFALWGAVLIVMGVYRGVTSFRFLPACFTLGGAFLAMAYFLPPWTEALVRMLVERYPTLIQ